MTPAADARSDDLEAKSVLILGGDVKVPEGFSHPSAEPKGEGEGSIMISFGGTRIRKRYSCREGEFELVRGDGGWSLLRRGEPFLDGIGFVECLCHSPFQANISLGRFGSDEEMMERLESIARTGTARCISVASGRDTTLDDCVRAVSMMHAAHPELPIGIRCDVCSEDDLIRLRDAGASEFKFALQSAVPRIFGALNPGDDLDRVLGLIRDAVGVFGRGRVSASLSVGLGETDEEAAEMFRTVSALGAVSDLKVKRPKAAERARLEGTLGPFGPPSPEKLASYAVELKESMAENGLDASGFRSLCISCRGCNLVPFLDFRSRMPERAG